MMPIRFDKQRAEYFVECITSGKAIAPAEGAWNAHEMLSLAGVLYFACMSHGPAGANPPMASEHQEAVEESFTTDLKAAIEFCAMLTEKVVDHKFDDGFEPTVEALLSSAFGTTKVRPVSGFKSM